MRIGYLSLTRGEGGQDLIGPELGDPLGVIRTQELLAARRIDGGEQFFTRAKDFGFSKSYEQTLAKWDRQGVLSDIVRVIRTFQPDVIVTRFPPEPGGTHGHHTASTVLALEAFKLAGDPQAFPEQLGGKDFLISWQPKRIFWNAFRGSHERPTLRLDIGGYLPLLGKSVGQISALSRSSHRSQGYGSIASYGSRLDEFQSLDGQPVGKDIFDGIDTTWTETGAWTGVGPAVDDIITHFEPLDPSASVPALLAMRSRFFNGDTLQNQLIEKSHLLDRIIQDCLGVYVQATVPQAEVVPGEVLKITHAVMVGSNVAVHWEAINFPDGVQETVNADLRPNQPVTHETMHRLPAATPLSEPYWLREEGTPGMYRVDDPTLIGRPENPTAFPLGYVFEVNGQELTIPIEPMQITADPVKGEIHRRMDAISPVSLTPAREVQLFAPGSEHPVDVEIRAYRDNQNGALTLAAPTGWKISPESQPFQLAAVGDHARLTFNVTAPAQPTTGFLTARATIGDKTYDTTRQEIRYDHIPPQLLQPPARVKAVCLNLQTRGHEIGYLPGAGDRTAEAIAAMGYHVTPLTGTDLTTERLRGFDAVVIGVRAFNVRTDLAPGLPALFTYVENGGTVVEQYNTPNDLRNPRLAPYDLALDRNLPAHRVTNENAPVTFLAPDHPAFNAPNKITPADFEGWVQERGLNFPSEWDKNHWITLLACSDPDEAPLTSGLLIANHGKGHYVYTGLSFFRQLPAGVPGAYRLFANLLSFQGRDGSPSRP